LDAGLDLMDTSPTPTAGTTRLVSVGSHLTRARALAVAVAAVVLAWLFSAPTPGVRLPLGEGVAAVADWFVESCAWLYEPIGALTDWALNTFLLSLQLIPAPALCVALVMLAWFAAGPRLALLTGVALLWVVSTSLWTALLESLAIVSIAVAAAAAMGIVLGILTAVMPRVRTPVGVVLDAMQTIPVFVYLLPVVLVFGPGDTAAVVVTIIYALPPMVRLTDLGIRLVPHATVEAASSLGVSRWQLLRDVQVPLALPQIRAGLNQTIMLAIAMSVIAAIIGAGGLGSPVWSSLGRLEFGQALDAGIALVLIAIILDRASGTSFLLGQFGLRRRAAIAGGVIAASAIICGSISALRFADFSDSPEWLDFSLRGRADTLVDWLNISGAVVIDPIKNTLVVYLLNPLSSALAAVPWLVVVVIVAIAGSILLGLGRGLLLAVLTSGIGFLGLWSEATETVAITGVSVVLTLAVALPLGVAASADSRVERALRPILDTLQSLPIFLFVIPAVVVLGSGLPAGILATVLYTLAPACRLTCLAIKEVDPGPLEASTSVGTTYLQRLRTVSIPLGAPMILTGINQSVTMALAMSVVSSFIGAPGLGRTILVAVAQVDLASGVAAGVCMLILATVFSQLLTGLAGVIKRVEHVQ
jgi:glycine betaine/proline transport system permease protein